MDDLLLRALGENLQYVGIAAEVTNALNEAIDKRHYDVTTATLVGKMLLLTAMLASSLKGNDYLTLYIRDPEGRFALTAVADSKVQIKASSNLQNGTPDKGKATFTLAKDLGLKEPYSSCIDMDLSDFEKAVSDYLKQSEQSLAKTCLHINFDETGHCTRAFGYMLQALPFATLEATDRLFSRFDGMLKGESIEFRNMGMSDILDALFRGSDHQIIVEKPILWHCGCSKEKAVNSLRVCGSNVLRSLIAEGKTTHVDCAFCGNSYYFTVDDLRDILKEIEPNKA